MIMEASFCDDCIHVGLCKYEKRIREYEERAPVLLSGNDSVNVRYSASCTYRRTQINEKG